MHESVTLQRCFRFNPFELDVRSGELRKEGTRIRVPDQSIQILHALVARPGDVVTREELRDRLWPSNTFVDFERGLNSAVRRLREALGDSADAPKFIETLPKRGYRFIGTLADSSLAAASVPTIEPALPLQSSPPSNLTAVARRSKWLLGMAGGLLTLGIVAAAWLLRQPAAASPPESTLTRLTFDDGLQTDSSIAPDGHTVAYASDQSGNFDIWTQRIAGGNPVQVTSDPEQDWQPDFSPDGNRLVFRSERGGGGLFVVPVTGGVEQRITEFGYRPLWSPDGKRVLFARTIVSGSALGLHVTDLEGGRPHPLQSVPDRWIDNFAAFGWHADSKRVAVLNATEPFGPRLSTVDIDTGTAVSWQVVTPVQRNFKALPLTVASGTALGWKDEAAILYFVGISRGARSVWSLDVDARSARVVGGPHRISSLPDADGISVSPEGRQLILARSSSTARLWSYPADGTTSENLGAPSAITPEATHAFAPALSRDGRQLLYMVEHPASGRRFELVTRSMASGLERTVRVPAGPDLSTGSEWILSPRWNAEGTLIVFNVVTGTAADARQQLRVLDVARGTESPITSPTPPDPIELPSDWSPDGKYIVSTGGHYVPGRAAVVLLPLSGAPHAETGVRIVTSTGDGSISQASMSPDGRWIVFRAGSVPGRRAARLAVVSADGGDASEWTMITTGEASADKPRWSADGRVLYFTSGSGAMMNVSAIRFDTARGTPIGAPFPLTQFQGPDAQLLPDVRNMEIAVGGGRVILPVVRPKGGLWILARPGR